MIDRYIKELLFEQDCVVIPDFGGFIANYVSADIHPIRHTFAPPSKNIAFNEMLRLNDGLLASHVAQFERISREEALSKIKDFTSHLREELKQKQKYRLAEIGTLFLNQEQKIQFEPENRINYLNDSFGLPELLYKPIERNAASRTAPWTAGSFMKVKTKDRSAMPHEELYREEEEEAFGSGQPTRLTSRLWMFIGVPAVFLLAAATGAFLFFDDGNTVLSSFNPFTTLYSSRKSDNQPVTTTNQAAAAPTATVPAESWSTEAGGVAGETTKENAISEPKVTSPAGENPTETNTAETTSPAVVAEPHHPTVSEAISTDVAIATDIPRYYVIVGSFARNRNALKLRKRLVNKGITNSKLIIPAVETNLHKVSYADFPTLEEAATQADELKGEYGSEVWVFRYVKQ